MLLDFINPIYIIQLSHTILLYISKISAMKNKMYAVQTNLYIQLSYLGDQRNLKIYNNNNFKKPYMNGNKINIALPGVVGSGVCFSRRRSEPAI